MSGRRSPTIQALVAGREDATCNVAGPDPHRRSALAARLSPRAALRRTPRAAWVCALVACLNAACWSIVTPPFEAPDEPSHVAYVKQLAETGELPSSSSLELSHEESVVLAGLHVQQVVLRPQSHTIASRAQERELEHDLAPSNASHGSPAAGVAATEPPLYYALEAVPYDLARGGTLLDRLALMRLMSALFAGLTALFTFLFVREALPGAPWSWSVAGLAVALAPQLGFICGSVNPDAMLIAVSAASFYVLARAFRRGFGARAAIAIGAVSAIGLVTKLNFVGLIPGVLVGLVVLSVRAARVSGRRAYRWLALAVAIGLSPAMLYLVFAALSGQHAFGPVSGVIHAPPGSLLARLNYTWQLYLPRLPGTVADFPGLSTARQLWFDSYVGEYGWLDTRFPGWVDSLALVPAAAIAVLCGRSLIVERAALRRRSGELAAYAVSAVGLLALIGAYSYQVFPKSDEFAQVRYLLPLLALLGGALVLAARGAGRRWGPLAGVSIVIVFLAHDLFSQLQVLARFYG